jgi:U4/U6 small nuclear ribonucleoprotein PRP3
MPAADEAKRPRDAAAGEEDVPKERAKRQRRWEDAAPDAAAAAAVEAAPATTDATAKAAAVLAKQAELAAKLAKLKQLRAGSASATAGVAAPQEGGAPAAASVAAAVAKATAAVSRFGPPPGGVPPAVLPIGGAAPRSAAGHVLRVDARGREVDEAGHVVPVRPVSAAPTLKVNARAVQAKASEVEARSAAQTQAEAQLRQDTVASGLAELLGHAALGVGVPGPAPGAVGRRKGDSRALRFVEPGQLTAAAETSRLQHRLREALGGDDEEAKKAALRAKRQADALARAVAYDNKALAASRLADGLGDAEQQELLQLQQQQADAIPEMEPWDAGMLGGGGADLALAVIAPAASDEALLAKLKPLLPKVTQYVEHPVPVAPVGEAPPPPPQPLRLTTKEQKKLRTQRRKAREQERQDMIRQGLLEPPPPKVKISNLMRVLGAEATADPTAIEQRVRQEMAARQQAHDDRNASRQLTPGERKEKALRKMFGDGGDGEGAAETWCCVYRVERLNSRLNQLKVCLNAEENHLHGVGFKLADAFCVVVVEGGRKAVTRFDKVMTKRMDWSLSDPPPGPEDPDDPASVAAAAAAAAAAEEDEAAAGPNKCTRVWRGLVDAPKLRRFKFELIKTANGAAAYLGDKGLKHVWDLACAGVEVD